MDVHRILFCSLDRFVDESDTNIQDLPCQEGNDKDEGDLADLVPREDPSGLLRLDSELLLYGGEHRGEVGVAHALHRPQHRVQQDVDLSTEIIAFCHE